MLDTLGQGDAPHPLLSIGTLAEGGHLGSGVRGFRVPESVEMPKLP